VTSSPDDNPSASPSDVRFNARLDPTTRQKVDDLAWRFHQPRAAVLISIMQWGLDCGPTDTIDHGISQGSLRQLSLYVPFDLYARVQQAATAAGVQTSPWLRHMVRQISITDFPASWQEEPPRERSHDSRHYGKRFMMRLDPQTWETLEELSKRFEKSAAEIIRQLVAQATPDDFPQTWQTADGRRRPRPRREASTRRRQS
jgi:predicted transcriptional regulator